jgi:hypothetical protein
MVPENWEPRISVTLDMGFITQSSWAPEFPYRKRIFSLKGGKTELWGVDSSCLLFVWWIINLISFSSITLLTLFVNWGQSTGFPVSPWNPHFQTLIHTLVWARRPRSEQYLCSLLSNSLGFSELILLSFWHYVGEMEMDFRHCRSWASSLPAAPPGQFLYLLMGNNCPYSLAVLWD